MLRLSRGMLGMIVNLSRCRMAFERESKRLSDCEPKNIFALLKMAQNATLAIKERDI